MADLAEVEEKETDDYEDDKPEDILTEALENYEIGYQKERKNIDEAYEDLRFRRGEPADQWPKATIAERNAEGRPCLTINRIPQFVRQVTGDMRQMRPAIRVVPVDNGADVKTAETIEDVVRHIENRSMARKIYTAAGDSQVSCGIGHWKVITERANDSSLNQEIRIVGIEDGVAVIWDPDANSPTKSDAMWCHEPVDISRKSYEKQWPDKPPSDYAGTLTTVATWTNADTVRITAYWKKKPVKKKLAVLPDGETVDVTDADDSAIAFLENQQARIEEVDSYKVCRYLLTCTDVLEGPTEWPTSDIPIIPVIGEEVRIGREVYRHGIVRYARDPQRMLNYYASAEAEATALQPKAPWLATDAMVKKHRDLWDTANIKNHPVLIYDPDPKMPAGSKPERIAPPVLSVALKDGRIQAAEDMKAVIGIYDASLGQKSNETSGKAIIARQREGDTGTFVYLDNFSMAVQRTGEIIVPLIPHVYDTQRIIRIIGEDGKIGTAELNKPMMENGIEKILNDVTVGTYDVTVDTGPSYSSKREAAREGMTEFIRAVPQAAALIGDYYAKAQDWPSSDEIGERLEELLPPAIKAKIEHERMLAEHPEIPPDTPPQLSPEQQQAQQAQEAAVKLELENKALANRKIAAETQKILTEAQTAGNEQAPQPEPVDPMLGVVAQNDATFAAEKYARELVLMDQKIETGELDKEMKRHQLRRDQADLHREEQDSEEMARQSEEKTLAAIQQIADSFQNGMQLLAQAMMTPKRVVRGPNHEVVGVEPVNNLPVSQ